MKLSRLFLSRKYQFPTTRVALVGGLGNQFFQLASGLFVSQEEKLLLDSSFEIFRINLDGSSQIEKFRLPSNITVTRTKRRRFLRHKFFNLCLRASASQSRFFSSIVSRIVSLPKFFNKNVSIFVNSGVGFDPRINNLKAPTYMIGYFQNYLTPNIPAVRDKLMSIDLVVESEFFKKLKHEALSKKILIVHVRLSDYKKELNFGLVGAKYYQCALEYFANSYFDEIWLFSDEPDEAKNFFHASSSTPLKIRHEFPINSEEAFQLMRYGAGYIIANSTFSWWAAFLRMDQQVTVIAPTPWYKKSDNPVSIYPPDWLLMHNGQID